MSAASPTPTPNTYLELGARHVGQADGAREALVLLRVVILEPNLQLDCLREATRLLLVGASAERKSDSSGRRQVVSLQAGFWRCERTAAPLSSWEMPSRRTSV